MLRIIRKDFKRVIINFVISKHRQCHAAAITSNVKRFSEVSVAIFDYTKLFWKNRFCRSQFFVAFGALGTASFYVHDRGIFYVYGRGIFLCT